jgi:outer membrane lipoprotein
MSCSKISQDARKEAISKVPFGTLLQNPEGFAGSVVILGGYVLETRNLESETQIKVLQAPVGLMDEPLSEERSEGRFIIFSNTFLDPEIYSQGRKLTVAGTIRGRTTEKIGGHDYSYLKLEADEIYLWSKNRYPYPAYSYPPPGWYPYPFWWNHPCRAAPCW